MKKTTKRCTTQSTKAKHKARVFLNYVTGREKSVDDQVVMELGIELAEAVLGSRNTR